MVDQPRGAMRDGVEKRRMLLECRERLGIAPRGPTANTIVIAPRRQVAKPYGVQKIDAGPQADPAI